MIHWGTETVSSARSTSSSGFAQLSTSLLSIELTTKPLQLLLPSSVSTLNQFQPVSASSNYQRLQATSLNYNSPALTGNYFGSRINSAKQQLSLACQSMWTSSLEPLARRFQQAGRPAVARNSSNELQQWTPFRSRTLIGHVS